MQFKDILILLIFSFSYPTDAQISDFQESDFFHHINFGVKKVNLIALDDCAGICLYYHYKKNGFDNICIEDIRNNLRENYGQPPYSLFVIESYLLKSGVSAKTVKVKHRSYIKKLRQNSFILFIPPKKNDELGHFVYAMRDKDDDTIYSYEYDIDKVIRTPLIGSDLYNKWNGVLIIIN